MNVKKLALVVLMVGAVGAGGWYYSRTGTGGAGAAPSTGAPGGGRGGRGGGLAMTVDAAPVARREIADYITVVGNLIGEATVDVVPRLAGRIESVNVKMGDRVTQGQVVAKMDDRDVREQMNQAEANLEVNKATVRTRESDPKSAEVTLQRQKTMFSSAA